MAVYPLLAVSFIIKVIAVIFLICSVALILIILIQKGRGGGLSAAFGGGMASGILGSKTGDFLTWVTIVLVGIFLTLAVVMAKIYKSPTISDYGGGASRRTSFPEERPRSSELPRSPVLPSSVDEIGVTTSDTNEANDADSFGG